MFVKGDPTEGALVVVASKGGLRTEETRRAAPRVEEFPFSLERKRMTTIHAMPDGRLVAFMKGAPEVVLERCRSFQSGGGTAALDAAGRAGLLAVNESMAEDALRVLGIAYKELSKQDRYSDEQVEKDLVFLGYVGMMDPPREEAVEAVKVCRQVGIRRLFMTHPPLDERIAALRGGSV